MSHKAFALNGRLHQLDFVPPIETYEWRKLPGTIPSLGSPTNRPTGSAREDLPNLLAAAGILTRVR